MTAARAAVATAMPWYRRLLIGVIAGLLAAGTTEVVTLRVASADTDPAVGVGEYTGTPVTNSAVTLKGDGAFPGLSVTVSQTRGLVNQAITVSWSGLAPTQPGSGVYFDNYLQVMQCWGDDPTAPAGDPQPARETCEYGAFASDSKDPAGASGVPGFSYSRTRSVLRADVAERSATGPDGKPLNYDTNGGGTSGTVPFWPVTSGWPKQAADTKPVIAPVGQSVDVAGGGVFDSASTNEDDYGLTRPDGTGEELFETQTALESPSLGCGAPVTQPNAGVTGRACWLVVVPRGVTDDGYKSGAQIGPSLGSLFSSPLSMANWQHRLSFRLDFKPVSGLCPIGAAERRLVGSELATDALTSWQPTLCQTTKVPYNLTTEAEDVARSSILNNIPGTAHLALTTRPLEPDPDHPVAYAPVALSGFVIGFNIERSLDPNVEPPAAEQLLSGTRMAHLKLTPRLVAKLLTESYGGSVAPQTFGAGPPPYLAKNPRTLFADPDFVALNPEAKYLLALPGNGPATGAPLMTVQNADAANALWQWIDADSDARAFLSGQPDPWGMTVNPSYRGQITPIDNFPKSDPTCTQPSAEDAAKGATPQCVLDVSPYVNDMTDAAERTRAANPGGVGGLWQTSGNSTVFVPQWIKNPPQATGNRFVLCVTSTSEAARFGLQTASLRNAAGNFIAPDQAGLLAGEAAMTPSTTERRVRRLDPSSKAPGAYPGTMVTYAAVAIADIDDAGDPTARAQYADFISYAVRSGQAPGLDFGQLPPGYAPLPTPLRLQALAAISEIKSGKLSAAPPLTGSGGGGGTGGGGSAGNSRTVPQAGAVPQGGATPSGLVSSTRPPAPAAVVESARTPRDPQAISRWVLVIGLGVGLLAAVAAPFVRPRRRRADAPGAAPPTGG
ncbi:hypothetical protein [Rugosimonospora africana]|uniref:PBP domain-containing protein n=1 Tax=Rugosimonospora africana TaxID=556532 RepID=A0A8J3VW56_9ACTN|nr:hypothetical protein [Rugosimonospora africana]GIH20383.1 hypothetical protein Raf01_85550 [Rugosimonospora africana]